MDGKAYTRSNEGSEATSYWDTKLKRTVGVGFNLDAPGARDKFANLLPDVNFNDVYSGGVPLSDDQVDKLFGFAYDRAAAGAERQVKGFAALPSEAQAVIVDMVYQMGESGFAQFRRVRDALARGDRNGAADYMTQSLWYVQTPARAAMGAAIMRPADKRSAEESALAQKWVAEA